VNQIRTRYRQRGVGGRGQLGTRYFTVENKGVRVENKGVRKTKVQENKGAGKQRCRKTKVSGTVY